MNPGPQSQNRKESLLVFARFPELGKAKTRLNPAFGDVHAMAIYKQLAHKTIELASRFAAEQDCALSIHFSGGDCHLMASEFGRELIFVEQVDGDLGARLTRATEQEFSRGAHRVVVIGTDCYGLCESQLQLAFDTLRSHDVVLGPATDGGYYLIGMNHHQAFLFEDIEWGSSRVLAQTSITARQAGKSLCLLEPLPDVDHPEDVVLMRQNDVGDAGELFVSKAGRISVIIPTLNEAHNLPKTLQSVGRASEQLEIIVVDGGSTDGTLDVAKEHGCRAFLGNRGRAHQMNAGAAIATGETLLFLHADTLLPANYAMDVERCVSDGSIAGAFRLSIDGPCFGLRWVEWGANFRSQFFQFPYGDQALFLRAKTFFGMGAYRPILIMDDFDLVDRLRRLGKIQLLKTSVSTSSRRWEKKGIFATTLINQMCVLKYRLGFSPDSIAQFYHDEKED